MKKILTSIALASILTTSSFAIDNKTENVNKNSVIKAEKKAQNTQLIKEAVKAIQYTQDALIYLSNKKIDKAKDSIKKAIGELSDVLNSPNPSYLLPIDLNVEAYQFKGKLEDIKKTIKNIKKLIADNKLPEARELLNSLRDEIIITTVNLPLATYPAALNLSLRYLNENKIKEAQDILAMALSTLVEIDTIIPIPLIKANALVEESSKIVKKDKKQALKYLEEAKHQLKLAKLLGYTSKSDITYKMLEDKINKLEKEIKANNKTKSLFEELIQKLKEFKEKSITQTTK